MIYRSWGYVSGRNFFWFLCAKITFVVNIFGILKDNHFKIIKEYFSQNVCKGKNWISTKVAPLSRLKNRSLIFAIDIKVLKAAKSSFYGDQASYLKICTVPVFCFRWKCTKLDSLILLLNPKVQEFLEKNVFYSSVFFVIDIRNGELNVLKVNS